MPPYPPETELPKKFSFSAKAIDFAPAVILLILHAVLAVHALRQHNLTVDEGGHILSGLLAWHDDRFDVYAVNPPLVKLLFALPVVISSPDLPRRISETVSSDWIPLHEEFAHANRDNYQAVVFRARYVLVVLSVLGGWLVFCWARQLFGTAAGLVALCLWTLCPNVLGWSGVCTTDLGATVFGLAAVYMLRYYLHHPGCIEGICSGIVLGLALLSKFTLLILYPVFLLTWLAAWWHSQRSTAVLKSTLHWTHIAVLLFVSVLVVNIGYGFRHTGQPLGDFGFRSHAMRDLIRNGMVEGTWVERIPVPLPEDFVSGFDEQLNRSEIRSPGYLRGEWRSGGWWYFYFYALAVKLPLGTWLLAGLALVLACSSARFRASIIDELLVWLPAGAVVGLLSTQMRDQFAALRYVLPALPFLFIGVSRVGGLLVEVSRLRKRSFGIYRSLRVWTGGGVVIAALTWNAVEVFRVHPHYLSYFNELAGGPENGWQHLIEANIDWGQDLLFLKRWLNEHPEAQPLRMAYYGTLDPHLIGLDYQLARVGPEKIEPGWYAISVNLVCGAPFIGYDGNGKKVIFSRDAYRLFRHQKPVSKAGYSIFIYHVVEKTRQMES